MGMYASRSGRPGRSATRPRRGVAARPRPVAVVEPPSRGPGLDDLLAALADGWDAGRSVRVEALVEGRAPLGPDDLVELAYQEFCLAEAAGRDPSPGDYLRRFPTVRRRLARLFGLHAAISASDLPRPAADLPGPGDEIGPYHLLRELGRGGFARVFLAEESDLEARLVVVKVSAKPSTEPRLLARARHPHIVEVLRHASTGDGALSLVCMPFLGGASLSAVSNRRVGVPRSGRRWLADLDASSAPEYPRSASTSPARAILAASSYPRAVAWMVARLAEALDHADRRGVSHGDVKPSNVLLTADGVPMLFDFNLAVDWRAEGVDGGEAGGTMAYMAPERLRAIAEPGTAAAPRPGARHRADIYGLGLVLVELLTGRPPIIPAGANIPPRDLAAALAAGRERADGRHWPGAGRVPTALRAILGRCLAPEPEDRYARAAELAVDLDRWRADRPLAHADEPRFSRFARGLRRRRGPIAVGLAILVAGLLAAGAADWASIGATRERVVARLDDLYDGNAVEVFPTRRLGQWWDKPEGDPAATASRHLSRYRVVEDDRWRERPEFLALPAAERVDLEVWLLEQAWRLARSLEDRPDSPEDWRRALTALERFGPWSSLGPIVARRRSLRQRLGLPEPAFALRGQGDDWVESFLMGLEAKDDHAAEALGYFRAALEVRPDAFWPRYHAAAAACRVEGEMPQAEEDITRCIARRPANPLLHLNRAGICYALEHFDDALEECDRAIALAPDLADAYRNRALVRAKLGQTEGLRADIGRIATLTRFRGSLPGLMARIDAANAEHAHDPASLAEAAATAGPEAHAALARSHDEQGLLREALAEIDQALAVVPENMSNRLRRASLLCRLGDPAGPDAMARIVDHPHFEELLINQAADALQACFRAVDVHLTAGRLDRAIEIGRRALAHADRLGFYQASSRYYLGRALAVASRSRPGLQAEALEQLREAQARYRKIGRADQRLFDGLANDPLIEDPARWVRLLREADAGPG